MCKLTSLTDTIIFSIKRISTNFWSKESQSSNRLKAAWGQTRIRSQNNFCRRFTRWKSQSLEKLTIRKESLEQIPNNQLGIKKMGQIILEEFVLK
jgi:hypothetical protein